MAAIAFDTLKFARRLKEVGVPDAQAEAQAELMAEAFVFNMDALVTKDFLEQCLDARFARQDARIDNMFASQAARLDKKFAEQGARLDKKLAEQGARLDKKFADQDARFEVRFSKHDQRFSEHDKRFSEHDERFNKIDLALVEIGGELKLLRWMLALVVITTVIPVLQGWFGAILRL